MQGGCGWQTSCSATNTHRSLRSLLSLASGFVSQSRLRVPLNDARFVTSVLGIKRWLCGDHPRAVSVCVAVVFSTACCSSRRSNQSASFGS